MAGKSFDRVRKDGDQYVQNANLVSARTEDILINGYTAAATLSYRLSDVNAELASGDNKAFGGVSSLNIWVVNADTANATDTSTLTMKFYKDGGQVGSDVSVSLTSVAASTSSKFVVDASDVDLESVDDYSISGAFSYGAANANTKVILERVGGSTGSSGGVESGYAFVEGSTEVNMNGCIVNETGDEPLTDGEVSAPAMNAYRGMWDAVADRIINANRHINISPDHLQKQDGEGAIDVTNVAAATYREVFQFAGYDNATIGVICAGGVTVSLFGTNNPDADDTADTGWISISGSTIVDTTDGWVITGQEPWDRIMIKYVTSDASNSLVVDYKFGG